MSNTNFSVDEGIHLIKLTSLLLPPTSIHSLSIPTKLSKSEHELNSKLNFYKPVINRLSHDDLLKEYHISPLMIKLIFIDGSVHTNHNLKTLLYHQLRKRIRKKIPVYYKKRKRKKKWINPYQMFLTAESISKGKTFLKEKSNVLEKIEQQFEVDKEYLLGIMFVETRFGKMTGTHSVLNLFNSLYHLDKRVVYRNFVDQFLPHYTIEEDNKKIIIDIFYNINHLSNNFYRLTLLKPSITLLNNLLYINNLNNELEQTKLSYKTINKSKSKKLYLERIFSLTSNLLDQKIDWGYDQLRNLIIMQYHFNVPIHNLKGSWAGAFGFCQFLPSSYVQLANDGNGDGYIDLYQIEDALASIANYLKEVGFDSKNRYKIRKAIYRYNYDWKYVNTVESFALQLKNKKPIKISKQKNKKKKELIEKDVFNLDNNADNSVNLEKDVITEDS